MTENDRLDGLFARDSKDPASAACWQHRIEEAGTGREKEALRGTMAICMRARRTPSGPAEAARAEEAFEAARRAADSGNDIALAKAAADVSERGGVRIDRVSLWLEWLVGKSLRQRDEEALLGTVAGSVLDAAQYGGWEERRAVELLVAGSLLAAARGEQQLASALLSPLERFLAGPSTSAHRELAPVFASVQAAVAGGVPSSIVFALTLAKDKESVPGRLEPWESLETLVQLGRKSAETPDGSGQARPGTKAAAASSAPTTVSGVPRSRWDAWDAPAPAASAPTPKRAPIAPPIPAREGGPLEGLERAADAPFLEREPERPPAPPRPTMEPRAKRNVELAALATLICVGTVVVMLFVLPKLKPAPAPMAAVSVPAAATIVPTLPTRTAPPAPTPTIATEPTLALAAAPTEAPAPAAAGAAGAEGEGALVVRISPGGSASLEGWQVPDGGQRVAESHRFSGLEPRTYSLKVFRDGYAPQTRNVTVRARETTTVDVALLPES